MILIVGLGNEGSRYARTRHNIGFMVVDDLAERFQVVWKTESKLQAAVASHDLNGQTVVLAKPSTMMNGSGEAVQRLVQKFRPEASNVWLVFDDVDTPFGRLRIRAGGSAGGHQGVKSTIGHIGDSFLRLKVGISLNDRAVEPSESYVLKPFNSDEQAVLPKVVRAVGDVMVNGLAEGLTEATVNLV